MSISDENGEKTRHDSVAAMEFEVAAYLKRAWNLIRAAASKEGKTLPEDPTSDITIDKIAKDPSKPTEAELEKLEEMKEERWKQMARQIIDERKLTANGTTVTVAELDEQLGIKKAMGKSLEQMLPTRRQVNAIAGTIGNSVRKNTGTGIDFLDGLFGGATFGAAIGGFFKWMFSGFKGGFQGLKEIIAGNVGGNIKTSVVDDLTLLRKQLAGGKDDISGLITGEDILAIGNRTAQVPLDRVRGAKPTEQRLRDVKLGDIDSVLRDKVRKEIKETVDIEVGTALRKQDEFKEAYANEDKNKSWWDSAKDLAKRGLTLVGLGSKDAERKRAILDRVQAGVSDHLSKIMTNPGYTYTGDEPALKELKDKKVKLSDMSPETRALVLAAEARAEVKRQAAGDPDYKDDPLYSVVALSLPDQLVPVLVKKDKDGAIPWLAADGKVKFKISPDAKLDDTGLKDKALPEIGKIISTKLEKEAGAGTPIGGLLQMVLGKPLDKKQFDPIASSLAPLIVEMNGKDNKKLLDMKEGAYAEVSDRFRKALKEKATKEAINKDLKIPDAQLDKLLDTLADQLAVRYVQTELYPLKDPKDPQSTTAPAIPAEFKKEMDKRQRAFLSSGIDRVKNLLPSFGSKPKPAAEYLKQMDDQKARLEEDKDDPDKKKLMVTSTSWGFTTTSAIKPLLSSSSFEVKDGHLTEQGTEQLKLVVQGLKDRIEDKENKYSDAEKAKYRFHLKALKTMIDAEAGKETGKVTWAAVGALIPDAMIKDAVAFDWKRNFEEIETGTRVQPASTVVLKGPPTPGPKLA